MEATIQYIQIKGFGGLEGFGVKGLLKDDGSYSCPAHVSKLACRSSSGRRARRHRLKDSDLGSGIQAQALQPP